MMKRIFCLKASVVLIALACSSLSYANDYRQAVFFGDSLTDGGYFRPMIGANDNVGVFTTNPDRTWASGFARHIGANAQAITIQGGVGNNYAIGGARAGEFSYAFDKQVKVPSVLDQVGNYLATQGGKRLDDKTIYSVWVGANDLLEASKLEAQAGLAVLTKAAADTKTSVQNLHHAGAKYILVPNVPDVGLTPKFVGSSAQASVTQGVDIYNRLLLSNLKATGANVIMLDTFGLLQEVAKNPSQYGFDNMTKVACQQVSSSLNCGKDNLVKPNANKTYFFADDIHPTGRAHQMIADYAYQVMSAPSKIARTAHMVDGQISTLHHSNWQATKDGAFLWAQGQHQTGSAKNFALGNRMNMQAGIDFRQADTQARLSVNYNDNRYQNSDQTGAKTDMDIQLLGANLAYQHKIRQLLVGVQGGFGATDVQVMRDVMLDDMRKTHRSVADGRYVYAGMDAGYPMMVGQVMLVPYVGAYVNRSYLEQLDEKENSATAMVFDEQKYTSVNGKIGVQANYVISDKLNVGGDFSYDRLLNSISHQPAGSLKTIAYRFNTAPLVVPKHKMAIGATLHYAITPSFGVGAHVTHKMDAQDKLTQVGVSASAKF